MGEADEPKARRVRVRTLPRHLTVPTEIPQLKMKSALVQDRLQDLADAVIGVGVLARVAEHRGPPQNRGIRERALPKGMSVSSVGNEGVWTAKAVHERAAAMGVEIPIMTEVYRVLYEHKPPLAAVQELMSRGPKKEW